MDSRRERNEAARLRRIAQRQDPSYKPKRNFDDNGNRLYHGTKGEFMAQNPQYVGRRFQNPKGPDGKPSYTEAGLAYENFYDQKHPNRYIKTKADKRGGRGSPRVQPGAAPGGNQNVVAEQRMFIAPDPNNGYASSHVDSGVQENADQFNKYGDPIDTIYAGGSPTFNESTGRWQDYTGQNGTVTRAGTRNNQLQKPIGRSDFRMAGDVFNNNRSDMYGNVSAPTSFNMNW